MATQKSHVSSPPAPGNNHLIGSPAPLPAAPPHEKSPLKAGTWPVIKSQTQLSYTDCNIQPTLVTVNSSLEISLHLDSGVVHVSTVFTNA